MSSAKITEAALSLPLPERVILAQRLWDSAFSDEAAEAGQQSDEPLLEALRRRVAELVSGAVIALHYDEVMAAARRAEA